MKLLERIRKNPRLKALLQIDDTPRSIALGAAVGVWIALTPTVGIQMWLAVMVCLVLRCNRLWAIAMCWISNPITMIPMYYGMYYLGAKTMGHSIEINFAYFSKVFERIIAIDDFWDMMRAFVHEMKLLGLEVVVPMFLGGAILGTIFCVPTYILVYRMIRRQRRLKEDSAKASSSGGSEASKVTSESEA